MPCILFADKSKQVSIQQSAYVYTSLSTVPLYNKPKIPNLANNNNERQQYLIICHTVFTHITMNPKIEISRFEWLADMD